jgi:hypothetical protein
MVAIGFPSTGEKDFIFSPEAEIHFVPVDTPLFNSEIFNSFRKVCILISPCFFNKIFYIGVTG